jgi:two-component system LytT family sensor kinase
MMSSVTSPHSASVKVSARWPRGSLALAYIALPTLFALAGGVQTVLTGSGSSSRWDMVLWREALYWIAWVLLIPPIFRLCRWLRDGPQRWPRYLLGMTLGVALTIVLLPLIYELTRIGLWSIARTFSWVKAPPPAFWPEYRQLFFHFIAAGVIVFASTVIAWYAVTNYREARERRLESVELGAMLQQAQLQALRSQLNPHFLFNTLHSIAELIHENPRHAEQMLLQLGELLRKSLKTQSLEVPLSEELDFLRSYLAIEQMRLGDRLELTWKIDPAVLEARVPSLILQPIVENAIQHGIAVSSHRGRLEITASRVDEQLRLEVRDNGRGLSAAGHTSESGIGLANTRERLDRLYGSRSSLQLTNDQGLVVSMSLPWLG